MVSFQVAYGVMIGMIGGIFAIWISRVQEQITPIYKKLGISDRWIYGLKTLTELGVALFIFLLIILMIN